ncbi:MAG: hypothetical protein ABI693_28835 [Bryobacteraceae bacterium]
MHRTDASLLDIIYGIGEPDAHLRECPECSARLQALQAGRAQMLSQQQPEVSKSFLAAQRRNIWQRIETPTWQPRVFSPLSAGVAALVLVVALWVRPAPSVVDARADTQLLSEIAVEVDSPWLSTLQPLAGPRTVASSHSDSSSDTRLLEDIGREVESSETRGSAPVRALYSPEVQR